MSRSDYRAVRPTHDFGLTDIRVRPILILTEGIRDKRKVAITLDESTLDRLDKLVRKRVSPIAVRQSKKWLPRIEKAVWPKSARNSIRR